MSDSISVIIPSYNRGHLIGETLESALSQEYMPYEVIVVDDGSVDNTRDVIQSFGGRVRYVSQVNAGPSAARNTGIKLAQGEYLHFLDSDDILHPKAYKWLIEAMQGRQDRIVVGGYEQFEKSVSSESKVRMLPPAKLESFPRLVHGNFGPSVIFLTPRHLIEKVGGFNVSLPTCEDWELWLRIILEGAHFVTVREVVAYYRRHDSNLTCSMSTLLSDRCEVLQFTHDRFLSDNNLLKQFGGELLIAEHRVLRRWLARDAASPWVPRILAMIHELEQRGHVLPRSRFRRLGDHLLGKWSDVLALQFFRWFRPETYRSYLEGCN